MGRLRRLFGSVAIPVSRATTPGPDATAPTTTPSTPAAVAPPPPLEVDTDTHWRSLPTMPRAVTPPPLTVQTVQFEAALPTRQRPSLLAPLVHDRAAQYPSGVVEGIAVLAPPPRSPAGRPGANEGMVQRQDSSGGGDLPLAPRPISLRQTVAGPATPPRFLLADAAGTVATTVEGHAEVNLPAIPRPTVARSAVDSEAPSPADPVVAPDLDPPGVVTPVPPLTVSNPQEPSTSASPLPLPPRAELSIAGLAPVAPSDDGVDVPRVSPVGLVGPLVGRMSLEPPAPVQTMSLEALGGSAAEGAAPDDVLPVARIAGPGQPHPAASRPEDATRTVGPLLGAVSGEPVPVQTDRRPDAAVVPVADPTAVPATGPEMARPEIAVPEMGPEMARPEMVRPEIAGPEIADPTAGAAAGVPEEVPILPARKVQRLRLGAPLTRTPDGGLAAQEAPTGSQPTLPPLATSAVLPAAAQPSTVAVQRSASQISSATAVPAQRGVPGWVGPSAATPTPGWASGPTPEAAAMPTTPTPGWASGPTAEAAAMPTTPTVQAIGASTLGLGRTPHLGGLTGVVPPQVPPDGRGAWPEAAVAPPVDLGPASAATSPPALELATGPTVTASEAPVPAAMPEAMSAPTLGGEDMVPASVAPPSEAVEPPPHPDEPVLDLGTRSGATSAAGEPTPPDSTTGPLTAQRDVGSMAGGEGAAALPEPPIGTTDESQPAPLLGGDLGLGPGDLPSVARPQPAEPTVQAGRDTASTDPSPPRPGPGPGWTREERVQRAGGAPAVQAGPSADTGRSASAPLDRPPNAMPPSRWGDQAAPPPLAAELPVSRTSMTPAGPETGGDDDPGARSTDAPLLGSGLPLQLIPEGPTHVEPDTVPLAAEGAAPPDRPVTPGGPGRASPVQRQTSVQTPSPSSTGPLLLRGAGLDVPPATRSVSAETRPAPLLGRLSPDLVVSRSMWPGVSSQPETGSDSGSAPAASPRGSVEDSSITEAGPNAPRPPGILPLVGQTPPSIQRDFRAGPVDLAVMDLPPMPTATVETLTTTSTTIQREPQSAPTPPAPSQPAPNQSAAPAGAPAPHAGGATGEGDLDDLSRRLYDRIRDRLKAELYLDRERAGLLSDLSI